MTESNNSPFMIGDLIIKPGEKRDYEIPISRLVTGTRISIPLKVYHGYKKGPVIWLSAGIHGDEIQGVEIIRRVIEMLNPAKLNGTVIMVPIVNVHGFLNKDRYLPDRRDLNRCFPGSPKGSLASQIAYLFMKEIVDRCDLGIDLHTGSDGRQNLPHIRVDLDNRELRELAFIFGVPLVLHTRMRDGSLREAANSRGTKVLLYEGGEANRFHEESILSGVQGIVRILSSLNMIQLDFMTSIQEIHESRSSSWLRAKKSGIALLTAELGSLVEKGQPIGEIHDSTGNRLSQIKSHRDGILIARSETPLVHRGDALYHIAEVQKK